MIVHKHRPFTFNRLQSVHCGILNVVLICRNLLPRGHWLTHWIGRLRLKSGLGRKNIKGNHCVKARLLNIFGAISDQEETAQFGIFVIDIQKNAHFGFLRWNFHYLPLSNDLFNGFLQISQAYLKTGKIVLKLIYTNLLLLQGIQEVLFASFLVNFKEFFKNGQLNHSYHLDLLLIHLICWNQI